MSEEGNFDSEGSRSRFPFSPTVALPSIAEQIPVMPEDAASNRKTLAEATSRSVLKASSYSNCPKPY